MPKFQRHKLSARHTHTSHHSEEREELVSFIPEDAFSSEIDDDDTDTDAQGSGVGLESEDLSRRSDRSSSHHHRSPQAVSSHESEELDRGPVLSQSSESRSRAASFCGAILRFFSAFFGWIGVFATIFFLSLVVLKQTNSAYWEDVRSVVSPIFSSASSSSSASTGGIFSGFSLPKALQDISPIAKFRQTTFLLVGIGGAGHDGGNLTDSIQIVRFDEKDRVTLLSIPRDLSVNMNSLGLGGAGKINELYTRSLSRHKGNKELALADLSSKITEITGEKIDHVALIDFAGFIQFIDLIGGIEIDVPKTIVDTTYPDNNYGYQVFRINAGKQVINGSTALKYVRSRHSTSDFDRSMRQQLILQAIREKLFSLDVLSSPTKIQELYGSLEKNIFTDMSVSDMGLFALRAKEIKKSDIYATNLNESCFAISSTCQAGGLLYTPDRSLTAGIWTLLPQGATVAQMSKYDAISEFVDRIFEDPSVLSPSYRVRIYTTQSALSHAYALRQDLMRSGYQFDRETLRQLKPTKQIWSGATMPDTVVFDKNGFAQSEVIISSQISPEGKSSAERIANELNIPLRSIELSLQDWYVSKEEESIPEVAVILAPSYKFSR